MSAGSVTASGGGGSTMTTTATDGPPGFTSGGTGDDSTTGVDGTTAADSMPDSAPDSMPDSSPDSTPSTSGDGGTTFGAGDCVENDVCEDDGVCVLFVDNDGVTLVCSHGGSGEACANDGHCVSGQCIAEISQRGVVSTCA